MKIFLSYSGEDEQVSRKVAARLRDRGLEVFRWKDNRGGRVARDLERRISEAGAFLVLMSRDYLNSDWCRRERDLAMTREQTLQRGEPERHFIYVLKVRNVGTEEAGFLGSYDWLNISSRGNRERVLETLAETLMSGGPLESAHLVSADRRSSLFRNRRDELDRVLHELSSVNGLHFWLVISPPQVGKTWFLDRLGDELTKTNGARWIAHSLNLRDQPYSVVTDTNALLARLLGLGEQTATDADSLRSIAAGILQSGKSHLCLLDSAELLNKASANQLRMHLGRIYKSVQEGGNIDIRLAFVVASRQEEGWRGVTPAPRLSALSLTEFDTRVVQDALRDLASQMNRNISPETVAQYAMSVYQLSEGLPALLVQCLHWIQTEEWIEMGRLDSRAMFEELAGPYIKTELLSNESLYPWINESVFTAGLQDPGQARLALEHAFRVLAPYRFFTQSHLRHHIESDQDFAGTLESLGWSMDEIWQSISGTALLYRPLDEPWQEVYGAIRRLLCRYFHETGEQCAQAHREAREFVKTWADKQIGTEQAVGLVECVWHEAIALKFSQSVDFGKILTAYARRLSLAIGSSPALSAVELREFAAKRMMNNAEFQAAVSGIDGLLDELAAIVETPLRGDDDE